jgi:hypothetical protein
MMAAAMDFDPLIPLPQFLSIHGIGGFETTACAMALEVTAPPVPLFGFDFGPLFQYSMKYGHDECRCVTLGPGP